MFDVLKEVSLFAHLPDQDLTNLAAGVQRVALSDGELLFSEGDEGDAAYIIESGELEIFKTSGGRPVLLAVRKAGEVIGEMAVIEQATRMASASASGSASVLAIGQPVIDELLATSPAAVRAMFKTILEKVRSTESRLRQSERMAQLGTLTAGVAHELNNPAAAINRSSEQLSDALEQHGAMSVDTTTFSEEGQRLFADLMARAHRRSDVVDSLDRFDLEEDVTAWLESRVVEDAWQAAPELVSMGVTGTDLDNWEGHFGAEIVNVVPYVSSAHTVSNLVTEITSASVRVSDIVKSLKSYSFLDQESAQGIDVIVGIEDTFMILKQKIAGLTIVRDYQEDLPAVHAFGSALNQVWTNLIDNAADAMKASDTSEPTLRVGVTTKDEQLVVEVEDNGPGISPDVMHRVFDSFFTTKAPGHGTGLGLSISYGIVVDQHRGEIDVRSNPGSTVFRVVLPLIQEPTEGDDMSNLCEHLQDIPLEPIEPGGCVDCLKIGDTWVHLRYCVACQMIRCCDDSKNQHASKHAGETEHPVVRSAEAGEAWAWCYTHSQLANL